MKMKMKEAQKVLLKMSNIYALECTMMVLEVRFIMFLYKSKRYPLHYSILLNLLILISQSLQYMFFTSKGRNDLLNSISTSLLIFSSLF